MMQVLVLTLAAWFDAPAMQIPHQFQVGSSVWLKNRYLWPPYLVYWLLPLTHVLPNLIR